MREIRLVALAVSGFVVLLGSASVAAPPPPPPPGAMDRAGRIIGGPASAGAASYLDLFSDDVSVEKNGKSLGTGRAALAEFVQKQAGLHKRILHVSYGNPIMVAESISSISPKGPDVIQDCCFWARVTFYHLRDDHKVDSVQVTENGSFWGPAERPE